ncbi:MAG TPA: DUF3667 domain-containing protein [Cyclobacteriaceae bacterium]|nr:DUF3667 domain-containing protein [Cyclobacteriaceae bacterium]
MRDADPQLNVSQCLNCGTSLTGKYCSNCGQKVLPPRQTLGDLIVNFIGSFTSFESKFFLTLRFLLLKPGLMITDYNGGKRERYYHPARMYVFLSFIFFLLFSLGPDKEVAVVTRNGIPLSSEEEKKYLDSLQIAIDTIEWAKLGSSMEPTTLQEYDSIENAKVKDDRDGTIERFFQRRSIQLKQKYGGDYRAMMKGFSKSFSDNTPKMIFLLLPIFALILLVIYFRHDIYYSEHLVFTIFFYDFLFLMGSFMILFSFTDWLSWMNYVIPLFILFYLYKAMRKVYKQSRGKTILKFTLLFMMFSCVLLVALAINAVITLSLM